jgi:two-component system, cell cycle sensor histidine kinase and response regulator CckA
MDVGLPAAARTANFESSASLAKSSGMELAMARHEGGMRFAARLPVARAAEKEPVEIPLGNGERILVVEDSEVLRDFVHSLLSEAGYAVQAAGTGAEAIALVEKHGPPDVLICDMVLPGMNGRELCEGLKKKYPGFRSIFCSGHSQERLAALGIQTSDGVVLPKPFDRTTLLHCVRAALKK